MATQTRPILVTGATGQQGGAVARALLAKGQPVRVMTRNPEKAASLAKAGAEIVQGDLTNQAILQMALRSVHGVFAMSTPFEAGMEAEVRQGIMLADAAKEAGIAHYVYTSVGSAHRNTKIPHFESKWKVEGGRAYPEDRTAGDYSAASVVHGKFHHLRKTVRGGTADAPHEAGQKTGDGRTQGHRRVWGLGVFAPK